MAGWRVSAKRKRKCHELLKYTIQEKKRAVRKHDSNSCPRRNPHLFEQSKIQMLPVVRKYREKKPEIPGDQMIECRVLIVQNSITWCFCIPNYQC